MATGSAAVVASQVEDPPLPGGRYPKEYVTTCFTACGASVASLTYSFQSSFAATPSVWGGTMNADADASIGERYAASMSADDFTFVVEAQDGTNSSFTGQATFIFSE